MKKRRTTTKNLALELARMLQSDCSQSNRELARELNVDPATLSRVRIQLENDGLVQGYRAILNPEKFALATLAFVRISLKKKDQKNVKATTDFLSNDDRILEIHAITGDWDYLLKVRVNKPADLMDVINEKLQPAFNVESEEFMITMGTTKETSVLDIKEIIYAT